MASTQPRPEAHTEARHSTDSKFAQLLEFVPDAIVGIDGDGRIVLLNAQAEALFGYGRTELLGRPLENLVPERYRGAHAGHRGQHMKHPRPRPMGTGLEFWGLRRDGSEFPVDISLSSIEIDEEMLVTAAIRDASERKQMEERMRQLAPSATTAAIVESSDDAIIGKDLDGRIVSWNRGAERIYGYRAEEVVGEPVSVLAPPGHADELSRIMEKIRRGERVDHFDAVRVHKDGSRLDVSLTVSPLKDSQGRITGASTIARDVTQRKRVETELRRSNEDLEQFAYAVSHDLSEPLRVIAGFMDLLARRYEGRLDEEADRFIGFTVSAVERMQALIDDLMAYSRASRGAVQPAEVDTAALVSDALRTLEGSIAERGTHVEVGELPTVRAEPILLRQVFQNLIGNAVKFTAGEQPRVRISATREQDHWRFDIEDNGPGIDSRSAKRVFEMFKRLHGRDVPGTGIGLSIAKRLVERHEGSISVESAARGGCVFSFTIPDRRTAQHGWNGPA